MKIGIIGGSGSYDWPGLSGPTQVAVETCYAAAPVTLLAGKIGKKDCVYLPRHGQKHTIPPHKINYRANIDALSQQQVTHIIALNAVGGIASFAKPGSLVIPDQLIDYSWGREHTFFDEFLNDMQHIDFTNPLHSELGDALAEHCSHYTELTRGGVYGCVQGPRLETAAEIRRLARDGCDVVGMTLMPEAALAREKQITYISVCIVCNWAAGITEKVSIDAIREVLAEALTNVHFAVTDTLVNL